MSRAFAFAIFYIQLWFQYCRCKSYLLLFCLLILIQTPDSLSQEILAISSLLIMIMIGDALYLRNLLILGVHQGD